MGNPEFTVLYLFYYRTVSSPRGQRTNYSEVPQLGFEHQDRRKPDRIGSEGRFPWHDLVRLSLNVVSFKLATTS